MVMDVNLGHIELIELRSAITSYYDQTKDHESLRNDREVYEHVDIKGEQIAGRRADSANSRCRCDIASL